MFVNEVDNDPATQAVEIVTNYIKKNPSLGISVNLLTVEGNRTDSKKFLENSKCRLNEHSGRICTALACGAKKNDFYRQGSEFKWPDEQVLCISDRHLQFYNIKKCAP